MRVPNDDRAATGKEDYISILVDIGVFVYTTDSFFTIIDIGLSKRVFRYCWSGEKRRGQERKANEARTEEPPH